MKIDGIRAVGWGAPILCMLILGFVLYSQNSAFKSASQDLVVANKELDDATKDKETTDKFKSSRYFATIDETNDEESSFLTYLRTTAGTFGVTLVQWSSTSAEFGKDKSISPVDAKSAAILKGIRRVSSSLTLSGKYFGLRQFIGELESSNRLYSLSGITWNRTDAGDNSLNVTVSRYVSSPNQVTETTTTAPK